MHLHAKSINSVYSLELGLVILLGCWFLPVHVVLELWLKKTKVLPECRWYNELMTYHQEITNVERTTTCCSLGLNSHHLMVDLYRRVIPSWRWVSAWCLTHPNWCLNIVYEFRIQCRKIILLLPNRKVIQCSPYSQRMCFQTKHEIDLRTGKSVCFQTKHESDHAQVNPCVSRRNLNLIYPHGKSPGRSFPTVLLITPSQSHVIKSPPRHNSLSYVILIRHVISQYRHMPKHILRLTETQWMQHMRHMSPLKLKLYVLDTNHSMRLM
jgi:hypothetical protein